MLYMCETDDLYRHFVAKLPAWNSVDPSKDNTLPNNAVFSAGCEWFDDSDDMLSIIPNGAPPK